MSQENAMPASNLPDRHALILDPAVFQAIVNGPPRVVAGASLSIGESGFGKTGGEPAGNRPAVQP